MARNRGAQLVKRRGSHDLCRPKGGNPILNWVGKRTTSASSNSFSRGESITFVSGFRELLQGKAHPVSEGGTAPELIRERTSIACAEKGRQFSGKEREGQAFSRLESRGMMPVTGKGGRGPQKKSHQ